MKILLVEPNFPIPPKSKNHAHFLPIGLLKIASYHRSLGDKIELHRGNYPAQFYPDQIKITSLFTYWSKYVWESVSYYRKFYPKSWVEIGGIYASLMPEHSKESGCDKVEKGLYRKGVAEKYEPAYDLVDVDYQIIHASRGCPQRCSFCGTWKIEPEVTYKKSIKDEIKFNRIIFYDNNLLTNPHIKNILEELAEMRLNNRCIQCESQSGFDRKMLTPEIAFLLKRAHFKKPRIAWDEPYSKWSDVKEKIEVLKEAGFNNKEIFIFMLYNHELPYEELRRKLDACKHWQVQVIDCRYRPLNLPNDRYNPRAKSQRRGEYYIHPNWEDWQVRRFRRSVRRQNICVRYDIPKWLPGCEERYIPFE